MSRYKPCPFEYTRGTGVAQTIGNWGFSNEVASPGHELHRMQCLLKRMEALREKPKCSSHQSESKCSTNYCSFKPKHPKQTSELRGRFPLITYSSVDEKIPISDKFVIKTDNRYPVLERSYFLQRDDKWYRLEPLCCTQLSCPAPCYPTYYDMDDCV